MTASPIFQTLAVIAGAALLGSLVSLDDGNDFVDTVVGLVAIYFTARLVWKVLLWWYDRIVVTDQRIFEVSGVLTRKVASIPLERVTDMTYQRSIGGRVLGYGEVIFETAGQVQALDRIHHLPQPDDFYRTITSLVTARPDAGLRLDSEPPDPEDDDTGPLPRVVL